MQIKIDQHPQLDPIRDLLEKFPGESFEGSLTGHPIEWRCEYTIDWAPSASSDESEDEIYLLATVHGELPENGKAQNLSLELHLEHFVPEVGVENKQPIAIRDATAVETELRKLVDEWDLRQHSFDTARVFIEKVCELSGRLNSLQPTAPGDQHALS